MSAAPVTSNGALGLEDAAEVLKLLESSVHATEGSGGLSPGTEEALQRAADVFTSDLSVQLLLALPELADTKQELRVQWQAVGLLLVRLLRPAPSLLTPAACELLGSLQMLAMGLGPTAGAPNRADSLPILLEAGPLLARLAQDPQNEESCKQLQSLALIYWRGARGWLLIKPGPLREQFRSDPQQRNAMRLAVLSFLQSTAQTAPKELPTLLVTMPDAAVNGAGAEGLERASRSAPSTLDTALESLRLLHSLYQGEGERCEEFRDALSQTLKVLRSAHTLLRGLEMLTGTGSARLVAAQEHMAAWMDRLQGISELLLSMAAEADAAPGLSAAAVTALRAMVNMVQLIIGHIQCMSGAPGAHPDLLDPSRWLRGRCLNAARALLKLQAAMPALQHGLAGAIAAMPACNTSGQTTKMLSEWEEMRQQLHPAFSAEVVGFAASLYFTLWDTTGLNELESAEMRSAHARMKALGGTASEAMGWVETCLGFDEIPREQRSLEDRFAQREEELPADAAVRLHRKLVARQQQQAQKQQKQQAQLSEAELKAKEAAARAAAEALLREEEEAEARWQQQSAGKAAKNKAKRERQKQQRKQEQEQAAELAKQAQPPVQAKQPQPPAQLPEQPEQQQQQQPTQPEHPPSPVQAEQAQPRQPHGGSRTKDNLAPAQPAAAASQAAVQPSTAQRPLPDASNLPSAAAPAAAAPLAEQPAAVQSSEEADEDAEFLMMLAQLGVQEPSLENLAADSLLSPPQHGQQQWQQHPQQLSQQPQPAPQQAAAGAAAPSVAPAVAAAAPQEVHFGGHSTAPLDDADECVVCMSSPRQAVLVPCGHLVLCTACAQHLFDWHKGKGGGQPQCPFCRTQVVHYVPLKH